MTRREKINNLFIELINYQLKEHNVTYDDVKASETWYTDYSTTFEKEEEFRQHIIKRSMSVLKLNKKRAELEANWFILQWGLTTNNTQPDITDLNRLESKKTVKD